MRIVSFGVEYSLDERRETDTRLDILRVDRNGWTLGWRFRLTRRPYGEARQAAFLLASSADNKTFEVGIAAATGADNLPRFDLALSHQLRLDNRWTLASHLEWKWFSNGEIATFTPSIIHHGESGTSYSLRVPVSASSEANGSATVADLRLSTPINDALSIRAGVVYGSEFDQSTKRRVRGFSIGISQKLKDRTRIDAGVSTGPYADTSQIRLNVGVIRQF